jgi:signal peptidase II
MLIHLTLLKKITAYWFFFTITCLILIADQGFKLWIQKKDSLPLHNPPFSSSYWPYGGIEIIPNILYLCHLGNKGAAWGILQGYGNYLALLAVLVLISIYYYRKEFNLKQPVQQVAFGLLCGGIIGNLVDRITHGYVIDFLDLHLPGYRWPAFNIADSAICIGIILYLFYSISQKRIKE